MKTKSRKHKSYSDDDMLAAYHDVRKGMSVRRAAFIHNVPQYSVGQSFKSCPLNS